MIIPVILAGGSGTRLWPLSRELYPKQLLNLTDHRSMLQHTLLRVRDFAGMMDPIVICNETQRFAITRQLEEIGVRMTSMILEPVGRNTAPAVAVAARKAMEINSDAIIVVLPADHIIQKVPQFHHAMEIAEKLAQNRHLVTFGVVPDGPETGYGYIRKGDVFEPEQGRDANSSESAFVIDEFVEKPDLATAKEYVDSGHYCWNSGMFMFLASQVVDELKRYAPDIDDACDRAYRSGVVERHILRLDPAAFADCRSDSIDYAIMEKTQQGVMVPFQAGWSDLGSWEALWVVGEKDAAGNVIHGDVLARNIRNSLIHADSRLVAAVGVENIVVVETPDAVLVSDRRHVQDVKAVVDTLKTKGRKETIGHEKGYYPWGDVDIIADEGDVVVRRVTVLPNAEFSLYTPAGRTLHWNVIQGRVAFEKEGQQMVAGTDHAVCIEPATGITVRNADATPLTLIEVFSPHGEAKQDHFTAPE